MKEKENKLDERILKEKNKAERLTLPDFKTYYKARPAELNWDNFIPKGTFRKV